MTVNFILSVVSAAVLPLAQSALPHQASGVARVYYSRPEVATVCDSLGLRPLYEPMGLSGEYLVTAEQAQTLRMRNVLFDLLAPPTSALSTRLASAVLLDTLYHTYDEVVTFLMQSAATFPQLVHVESIGVSQQLHRTIYALKVSDSVTSDEDEPVVYFDGAHHACEVMGVEICLALIDTLLRNYASDPVIAWLVDNTEIWMVPLVNPDGHSAVMDSISLYYRKNGRDLNGNGILFEYQCNNWWTCPTEGVDLNRNYDWYWQFGGSSQPWHYYYRGPAAASEAETQAINALCERIKPQLAISYHSYGELVFFPWNFDGASAPDHAALFDIARGIAHSIRKESMQSFYDWQQADGRGGLSLNWLYGRHGTFAYVVETVAYPDFIVPLARYQSIIRENLKGCFYLLRRAHGAQLTGRVTAFATGLPLQAEIRILDFYSDIVAPRLSDSLTGRYRWLVVPDTYDIQVIAPGFPVFTFHDVVVRDSIPTVFDIALHDFLSGDANGSGDVTGADVTYLVRFMKGIGNPPQPLLAGDANGDCNVRGSDVVYLVAYLKGGQRPRYGDCR